MATIKFENGTRVNFNGTPTQTDIEEMAVKLGIQKTPPTQPTKQPSTFQRFGSVVGEEYKQSGELMLRSITTAADRFEKEKSTLGKTGALLESALGSAAAGARSFLAPITGALKFGMGGVSQSLAEKSPVIQKLSQTGLADSIFGGLDKASRWAEENPRTAENLSSALEVITALAGTKGKVFDTDIGALNKQAIGGIKSDITGGINKLKTAKFEKATNVIPEAKIAPEIAQKEAWEIAQPQINDKTELAYRQKGAVTPREGIFKGSKLQPLEHDKQLIDATRPLVESGELRANMKPEVQADVISRNVSRMNQDVGNLIADNDAPANISKLNEYLNAKKADAGNKILFKSDKSAEKVYNEVISEYKKFLGEDPTNLDVFQGRQGFDNWARAKFPQAFKLSPTGEMTPTNNAIANAIRDVRQAPNEYISDILPPNNPYKALLRGETNLLQVMLRVNEKALGTLGEAAWQTYLKNHPAIRRILYYGGGALIGGAVGSAAYNVVN